MNAIEIFLLSILSGGRTVTYGCGMAWWKRKPKFQFDLRAEARNGLADWYAKRMSVSLNMPRRKPKKTQARKRVVPKVGRQGRRGALRFRGMERESVQMSLARWR